MLLHGKLFCLFSGLMRLTRPRQYTSLSAIIDRVVDDLHFEVLGASSAQIRANACYSIQLPLLRFINKVSLRRGHYYCLGTLVL